ncbi:MAG: DUF1549 and DUF1553 domain-containing protein [Pirellulales bacterium]
MRWTTTVIVATLAGMSVAWADDGPATATVRVVPAAVRLTSPEASEQLLVLAGDGRGGEMDVARAATYRVVDAGIVAVSPSGRIDPIGDGKTRIAVSHGGSEVFVPVEVRGVGAPAPISFRRDVIPVLSKAGCNSGGCHGKAEGQNGFKLSVFGYDPAADHQAIISQGRGRRVFPAAPDNSLLLLKATAKVPHGGGRKIDADSRWYRVVRRWIAEGMTLDEESADPVARIAVEPSEATLAANAEQQLRVVAIDAAGGERCVTAEADYRSNQDTIAGVSRDGVVRATDVPGEAAILVRYLGHVAVCRVIRPREGGDITRPAERNFIDRLAWDKLVRLRIAPSEPADDATFLRRVYLDTIGTLPTPAEARRFLAEESPDKRRRLVAELLDRPEYADYWAQQWSDLLQIDKDIVGPQSAVAMTRWVRSRIAANAPFDEFAREVLTAQGSTLAESPAAFFQVHNDPQKLARSVSQLFLGVRIECAQCHHHPFERWDQKDYFALAGFFTGVERVGSPIGGVKIVDRTGKDLTHPRTGQIVPTAALGSPPVDFSQHDDRRRVFANWATSVENPYFARTIVNRLWAHYFGRGLVEPVDDLRATNPATNEPLMDALVEHLVAVRFDIKQFTKTLLDSQLYQLASGPTESNRLDEQNYSHAAWKPLPAEVLLDAISQATAVDAEFVGWPRGYRAIDIWDNKLPSHFLEVFGRPTRQSVCACERGVEPSMAQALHLMNAEATNEKMQHRDGRAAELARSDLPPEKIIDELFLATMSRFPNDAERKAMLAAFSSSQSTIADRRTAAEDVLWTLLNTKEFVFNH